MENLVGELAEFRLKELETRMHDEKEKLEVRMKYEEAKHAKEKKELEAMIKAMETRLELRDKEMEKKAQSKRQRNGDNTYGGKGLKHQLQN